MQYGVVVLAFILGLTSALPRPGIKLARPSSLSSRRGSRLGIYDGTSTTITDHPYLATVLESEYFYCAGAILSESWIITDVDCTSAFSKSDLSVVVGSSDGTDGKTYSIKKIVLHPDYDEYSYSYNYALIKVKGKFKWGDNVANVSLPSAEPEAKTSFVVAGYGDTEGMRSDVSVTAGTSLLQGTMKWQSDATCESFYTTEGWDESLACAYNKGKVTLCNGDFGDPFVKDGVLYGVALGGASAYYCTDDAWPVVIADVYPVVDWIQKYTGATIASRERLHILEKNY